MWAICVQSIPSVMYLLYNQSFVTGFCNFCQDALHLVLQNRIFDVMLGATLRIISSLQNAHRNIAVAIMVPLCVYGSILLYPSQEVNKKPLVSTLECGFQFREDWC